MIIFLLHDPQLTTSKEVILQPESMASGECSIGRSNRSDLVLEKQEISRTHAKIIHTKGLYYFIDQGSSGGSIINDQVAPANVQQLLEIGDEIKLGRFRLMITQMGDPEEATIVHSLPELTPAEYMPVFAIPPAELKRWQKGDLTVHCAAIIDEAQDVRTFRFVADPPVLFTYKPGQFVTLELEINGEEVLRSYSISSTPSRPHSLEITVKRVPPAEPDVPPGLVSNWLHDNIRVGSEVKLSGPLGKFTNFQFPHQKLLFISGGSGITPMMSMSRWICDTLADCDVVFLHSARTPNDIIYQQELSLLASRHQNFKPLITLTNYQSGQGWLGLRGRLTPTMISAAIPDFMERMVFVCGPAPFMTATKEIMLQKLHFPIEQYHEESFGGAMKQQITQPTIPAIPISEQFSTSPTSGLRKLLQVVSGRNSKSVNEASGNGRGAVALAEAPGKTPAVAGGLGVTFQKSDKQVNADGTESILELAEQNGVKIRSSCRSGSCGTCKKKKIFGNVRMNDFDEEALEPEEQAAGFILTCISFPTDAVTIDA
jgi:glycine betaine catabolism B